MKDSILLKQGESTSYHFLELDEETCNKIIKDMLPVKHKQEVATRFRTDFGFSILNIETIGELKDNEMGLDKYIDEKMIWGAHGNGVWEPSGNVIDLTTYKQRVDDGTPLAATERRQMTQKFYTAGKLIKKRIHKQDTVHGIIFRAYSKTPN